MICIRVQQCSMLRAVNACNNSRSPPRCFQYQFLLFVYNMAPKTAALAKKPCQKTNLVDGRDPFSHIARHGEEALPVLRHTGGRSSGQHPREENFGLRGCCKWMHVHWTSRAKQRGGAWRGVGDDRSGIERCNGALRLPIPVVL